MQPIHDADVILLLAIALSAKRRPADLGEIFAAIDLITSTPPAEAKLVAAFARLSTHGLIVARDGGTALTDAAESVVSNPLRKSTMDERLFSVREQLAAYRPAGEGAPECTPITLTEAQLAEAQAAHALEKKAATRNLLMPKPVPAATKSTGPGFRQRKPMPAKRRKFSSGR